jgi:hypothetical protein
MDRTGPWGWDSITKLEQEDVLSKMSQIEELTWVEASSGSTPRLKRIPIGNICLKAQKRIQQLKLDDFGDVYELRINGTCRIWGLREEPAFLLLWWDPNHEVCPSPKKYT